MSNLERLFSQKTAKDPKESVTTTDVMVGMAKLGMLRAFEPDEQPMVVDETRRVLSVNTLPADSCKSNVHPILGAADTNIRRR